MRRWETYLALLAVVLASLSAVDFGGRPHPALALIAIGLLILLAYARLRSSIAAKPKKRTFDAYERALQIQEDRERRLNR